MVLEADVFVPNLRVGDDVVGEEVDAFLGVQVEDFDAVVAKPLLAALEIDALADDERADVELAHEAAAVPARRQRGHHDRVAVAPLPTGLAEGVGLGVHRRVVLLHAAVVTAAEKRALPVEHGRTDRDTAFYQARARLGYGDVQHRLVVLHLQHRHLLRHKKNHKNSEICKLELTCTNF